MAARALDAVDCSVQPLDFSFHPTMDILAAALVDGTVEVHDFSRAVGSSISLSSSKATTMKTGDDDGDNEEGEFDTILSSIPVHCDDIPKKRKKQTIQNTNDENKDSTTSPIKSMTQQQQGPSCRAILFDRHSNNGGTFYTAGNGGTLACLDTERASADCTSEDSVLWKVGYASPHPINTLYQLGNGSDNNDGGASGSARGNSVFPLVVSGDDEGVIRLWDTRMCGGNSSSSNNVDGKNAFNGLLGLPRGCVASFHENTDYITGFETDKSGNTLIASSADGTISIFDIRTSGAISSHNNNNVGKKGGLKTTGEENSQHHGSSSFKFLRKSDDQEDELLSICTMKGGRKVICGTQEGVLDIWSWGTWGDISDRFPGHPQSIDALLKVDENTLLTGSSDGLVRVVELHPNTLLGILGDHGGFPCEKLEFSAFHKTVGSLSHDNLIRLWDASILRDDDDENDNADSEEDGKDDTKDNPIATGVAKRANGSSDDDWEDMDDSDDSMDDSDDDVTGGEKSKKTFKSENEQFFEDL